MRLTCVQDMHSSRHRRGLVVQQETNSGKPSIDRMSLALSAGGIFIKAANISLDYFISGHHI